MNEFKLDIETDQELLLWNIMVMKFMFTHCTFSFAYLPIISIIVIIHYNCATALTMALHGC